MLHPMVVAIIAALALTAAGVTLPTMLSRSVNLLAQTSSGVALFAVGGMLVGLRVRGLVADIVTTVAGKLVLQPVIAVGILLACVAIGLPDLSDDLRAAVILTAALPTYSILPSMAEPYGEEDLGAAAMMLSVVVSFVTLTGGSGCSRPPAGCERVPHTLPYAVEPAPRAR